MSLNAISPTAVARGARAALNFVLPPRCLSCRGRVEDQGTLCAECWKDLTLLEEPCCHRCGYPFHYRMPEDSLCPSCIQRLPAFERARAVFRYDDASRALVLAFKHSDEIHGAPVYGQWLARAGAALLADADLIAPVPLHPRRLLRRRYNQAGLLAQAAGRRAERPVAVDLLRRRRHTASQAQKSPSARRRNVQGAFAVRQRWKDRIQGKRVVLVDDVLTTGATVEECARVLCRAGAGAVDVLTLARVIRAD